jgi:hypothetical protein
MVSDKCINRIVTWVKDQERKGKVFWNISSMFREKGFEMLDKNFEQKLAQALFQLNRKAVIQRYGKDDEYSKKGYKFNFNCEYSSDIQVMKSIGCFLYQCSEGDVPKNSLFKLFEKIESGLAKHIVSETKEYDNAEWG